MNIIGLLLSLLGAVGLLAGAALELSVGGKFVGAANQWWLIPLLDHRMMIVAIGGFVLVAGAVLYGFAGTQRALTLLSAMVREAIDAPDVCPAAPLLLKVPAPPTEFDTVVPLAGLPLTGGPRRMANGSDPLPR